MSENQANNERTDLRHGLTSDGGRLIRLKRGLRLRTSVQTTPCCRELRMPLESISGKSIPDSAESLRTSGVL